jgi:endo-1,4-beta-xylanase
MKNFRINICAIIALSIYAFSCSSTEELAPVVNDPKDQDVDKDKEVVAIPLKELFKDYFPIGAAITPQHADPNTAHGQALIKHFSSVTAENVMKPDALQRNKGVYTWDGADKIVQFAKNNNIQVRGHVLTWHSQTPNWMFYDQNGALLSKEVALGQLEEHITTVVSKYKDDVYAWDVVNEALFDWDPNGEIIYREDSPWYKIFGESYIDSLLYLPAGQIQMQSCFIMTITPSSAGKGTRSTTWSKG